MLQELERKAAEAKETAEKRRLEAEVGV